LRKKLIAHLLSLTILLLVANIIIDYLSRKNEVHFDKDLSASEIEGKFLETLDECGIELKWIKIKPNRDKEKDSIQNIINVKIPADLPLPVLLHYLQGKIEEPFIRLTAGERKKSKEIVLKIFSNGIQKLESVITKDDKTLRNSTKISFIISGFNGVSKAKQLELLKSPYPFAVELIPSEKGVVMIDSLRKYKKEHVVLLNDDLSGKKFLLNESFSNPKLLASIKNILTAYKYYPLYIIDTSSDLFSQTNYPIIEKALVANSIKLLKRNTFFSLDADKKEITAEKLKQAVFDLNLSNKTFLIDADNYLIILDNVDRLFRKGNKIILPGDNSAF